MPAEKTNKKLLWFRNNLRTHDNAFWNHISSNDEVVAVFCMEPSWLESTKFGWKKMEKFRAQFLLETLQNLKSNLAKYNIPLLVKVASAKDFFIEIYNYFPFQTIILNKEWTSEELFVEEQVKKTFSDVTFIETLDGFLIEPQNLPFKTEDLPNVFTVFRKKVEAQLRIKPLVEKQFATQKITNLQVLESHGSIPSLESLGYNAANRNEKTAFPYKGGESAALQHLENYIWGKQNITTYKETRNGLIGTDYSTKFSAWLANGSLSVKTIYYQIKEFEINVVENDSTYWVIFELLWREYFRYISLKHQNDLFKLHGILQKNYSWKNHHLEIKDWLNGSTKYDFVNANMIELQQTGWMSNRGRQNVASFFAKEKELDWRIGASYFEAMLIDYDVHSNYGNWNYLAGVGNDPRDRKFNIAVQADNYDKNHKYRNLWLK